MVVIEHNLDVIKTADYIIDMGTGRRRPRRYCDREGNAGGDREGSGVLYGAVCQEVS